MENQKSKVEFSTKCPECGSTNLIKDDAHAEIICGDCGLVVDEGIIDLRPDWRAFSHEDYKKRAHSGPPSTYSLHDRGLSTTIDWQDKDSFGQSISPRARAQAYRLRKWQRRMRVSDAKERNLVTALNELDKLGSKMNIPRTVRETASLIYRKAVQKNLIRGREIVVLASAALYAACRQCGFPRSLNEVSGFSELPRKRIGTAYRVLARELNLKIGVTSPLEFVQRFCGELEVDRIVVNKAAEILKEAAAKELTIGNSPTGTAAAAIYIACILCGERRTQRDIAQIAGVTEVTVRNRYKEISRKLGIYSEIIDYI